MPKMKTNRAARKRFKVTGTGKLLHERANRRHNFEHKPSTRTRRLAGVEEMSPADVKKAKKLLGR